MVSVNERRIVQLNNKNFVRGPVVYWMSRDQRVNDNWALIYTVELALRQKTFPIVVFTLTYNFPEANLRHYDFMLRGLEEVEKRLATKNIPFNLITGHPPESLSTLLKKIKAGAVVTDFDPLRIKKEWKNELLQKIDIPFFEVDAHNIVPCLIASDKQEFGAYTIRSKISRLLNEFMEEFPEVPSFGRQEENVMQTLSSRQNIKLAGPVWPGKNVTVPTSEKVRGSKEMGLQLSVDWINVNKQLLATVNTDAVKVDWLVPGENAAARVFMTFIDKNLPRYSLERNDPNAMAVSDMSPYLHFGQISAQRMALETLKTHPKDPQTDAYLEELIIRKELSDNFCHFNPYYDSFEGFPQWAKNTLNDQRNSEREYLYEKDQFESAQTHDLLWNAAQMEMVTRGKMHGYMRMYWAKKILEWSASPEKALEIAIYLNNKYELDGRDPNGYAGCAWSIGGVHDRAWAGRPVYGKIRYMNANGCKRKFNTNLYIKNNLNLNL